MNLEIEDVKIKIETIKNKIEADEKELNKTESLLKTLQENCLHEWNEKLEVKYNYNRNILTSFPYKDSETEWVRTCKVCGYKEHTKEFVKTPVFS